MAPRRAFTLIEFTVAATLIVAVFAASATVLTTSTRRQTQGDEADRAARVAFQTLETARALGCSLGTGNQIAADGADGFTDATANRCYSVFTDDTSDAPDTRWATDPEPFTVTSNTGTRDIELDVQLTSHWLPGGGDTTDPCTDPVSDQPRLIRRDVTVGWGNNTVTRTTFEAAPPDAVAFNNPRLGGVIARNVDDGDEVTITAAGSTLRRVASPAVDGGQSCAWFPYLEPGTYNLTPGGTVTVPAGEQVVVG